MARFNHYIDRENKRWNTRLIKDLSDRHLNNIIIYLKERTMPREIDTINFLETEQVYRENNGIIVPEYENKPHVGGFNFDFTPRDLQL